MTKRIRIENADQASGTIVCQVWQRGEEDALIETKVLANPTDLTELTIYRDRYIIISEIP
jgi:hypothetical protein